MSGGNIFLNYRRTDTAGHAGRIFDRLNQRFPGRVFRDVTGIGYGLDFAEEIGRKLESCKALIVLIGPHWLSVPDEVGGRRLDDENDFVRLEIATVLRRNIRVVPVLVGGAHMPSSADLPEDLQPLARRNALEITEPDFDNDVARLGNALAEVLDEETPTPEPQTPDAPPKRRAGLPAAALVASAAAVVLLVAGLAFYAARRDAPPAPAPQPSNPQPSNPQPSNSPPPTPQPSNVSGFTFDPVGAWDISGVGTDLRTRLELRADHAYIGRGKFQGVYGEGVGTWEQGENPRVVFFRAKLADGSEVTARMEVTGVTDGVYRAAHSYYGDLTLRRVSAR
jgi:TIR domain